MGRDKSLGIFLVVLFGILGIVILTLAWVWQMSASERILATFVGSSGLLVALSQALLLKSPKAGTEAEQILVNAEVKDKP
ncbi:MAG: hypothetical protein ACE5LA_06615 [Dehalococcoidales bacterium]